MTESIMTMDALPAFLANIFRVKDVRVKVSENEVSIAPVKEEEKEYVCPLLGIAKGGTLTVDKFLEMCREDKELEFQNEARLFS